MYTIEVKWQFILIALSQFTLVSTEHQQNNATFVLKLKYNFQIKHHELFLLLRFLHPIVNQSKILWMQESHFHPGIELVKIISI